MSWWERRVWQRDTQAARRTDGQPGEQCREQTGQDRAGGDVGMMTACAEGQGWGRVVPRLRADPSVAGSVLLRSPAVEPSHPRCQLGVTLGFSRGWRGHQISASPHPPLPGMGSRAHPRLLPSLGCGGGGHLNISLLKVLGPFSSISETTGKTRCFTLCCGVDCHPQKNKKSSHSNE